MNVLLIGVDQMRYDVLGMAGNAVCRTPNMDRLIGKSAAFTWAYTPCPLCTPARTSLFTGDYAFRHGMGTNCDMYHSLAREIADPSRLLHRHLLDAGYRCGFVGKWHCGTDLGPADFGFEGMSLPGYGNITKDAGYRAYLTENGLSYSIEPELYFNPHEQTLSGGRWRGPVESTPAHYLSNRTIGMLRDYAEEDIPFFLTCQYWDPHAPHLIADEFFGITDRGSIEPWPNFADDLSGKPQRVRRERDDFYRLHPRTENDVIAYIGYYYDHVAMLDFEIGRVLDFLDESGLAETTLVILTSDHGDMTGGHGGLIDKGLLYEEAIRVPLAFRHPDIRPGVRDALAMNMDILPTVLDFAGIDAGKRDGVSLKAILKDKDAQAPRDHVYIEYHGLRFLYSQRALIRDDGLKLIFSPGDYDELYELSADPWEMDNCVDDANREQPIRRAMIQEAQRLGDPLSDCISKFNGRWRTGSGQFDATSAYLK